ncbi:translation initiation factor IF-2-like [Coturnix japonica]|uniref:translation initiation factor IF-2-like n=1 Tax=Coturnix japonica TaxID=93934 RepID=UPI0007776C00|nr:translation initiation factor IF-2-like [Coturnix japonica]
MEGCAVIRGAMPCGAVRSDAVPRRAIPCYTVLYRTVPCYTVLYGTITCYTVPYRAIPCYTVPYRAIPYRTVPCYTVPYRAMPCYTVLYSAIPYYTVLYRTIPYYTVLYRTIPYHTVLYRTIPYYTVLYRTIPYHTALYGTAPPSGRTSPRFRPGSLPPAPVPSSSLYRPVGGGWSGTRGSDPSGPPVSVRRRQRGRATAAAPAPTGGGAGGHGRGLAHVRSRAPLPARCRRVILYREESRFDPGGCEEPLFGNHRKDEPGWREPGGRPSPRLRRGERPSVTPSGTGRPFSGLPAHGAGLTGEPSPAAGGALRVLPWKSVSPRTLPGLLSPHGGAAGTRRGRTAAGRGAAPSPGIGWGLNTGRDGVGAPGPGGSGTAGKGLRRAGKCGKQNLGSGPAQDGRVAPDRYLGTVAPPPRPVGPVAIRQRGGLRPSACRGSSPVLLLSGGYWRSPARRGGSRRQGHGAIRPVKGPGAVPPSGPGLPVGPGSSARLRREIQGWGRIGIPRVSAASRQPVGDSEGRRCGSMHGTGH